MKQGIVDQIEYPNIYSIHPVPPSLKTRVSSLKKPNRKSIKARSDKSENHVTIPSARRRANRTSNKALLTCVYANAKS